MSERLIQNLCELSDNIQTNPPMAQAAPGSTPNTQINTPITASINKYYEALQKLARE
jgi:hypothetical protein